MKKETLTIVEKYKIVTFSEVELGDFFMDKGYLFIKHKTSNVCLTDIDYHWVFLPEDKVTLVRKVDIARL